MTRKSSYRFTFIKLSLKQNIRSYIKCNTVDFDDTPPTEYIAMPFFRRVSRYLMDYRRPPFTLYRLPRKRKFFKFLFSETTQGICRWGWFADKEVSKNSFFRDAKDLSIVSTNKEQQQVKRLNAFKHNKNKDAVLITFDEKTPDDLIILGFNESGNFTKVFVNNYKDKIVVELNKQARNEDEIFRLTSLKLGRSDRAYYLWPDGMNLYFFLFAFIMALPILLNGTLIEGLLNNVPIETLLNGTLVETLLVAFSLFFSILWGLPFIIFYLFRIPVLDYLYNKLPETINERIRTSVKEKVIKNIVFPFFLLFKEKWNQVYYSSMGSFRGSLLRVALRDMYQKQQERGINTAEYHRTFIRWIFYWCSPVWGSFLCLVSISFVIAFFDQQSSLQNNLVYSCILWVACSIFYIKKAAIQLSTWTYYTQEHSRYLPPVLAGKIRELPMTVNDISEKNIEKVTSIVSGFVATTYISLIKFFIFLP